MEIKSFRKKNSNLYEISLTDDSKLNLYDDTIINFNLLVNKKLDQKKLEEILIYNSKQEAYYKALKYINIKLRTKKEIEKYLIKYNFEEKTILETITRLEKEKYLDDLIYIKAYLNDQINLTTKGPNLIKKEFLKLGFKEEQFQKYITEIDQEIWQEKIKKVIAKKIKSNHNLSKKMLEEKLKKALLNLGYSFNLILDELNKIDFAEDLAILEKEFNKELHKLKKKYQGYELKNKIKSNLYRKGFNLSNIDKFLANINE